MNLSPKDENLRLILSTIEREHIVEQRHYHKMSLIYCALIMAGEFFLGMVMPLMLMIFPASYQYIFGLFAFGLIVSFCAFLMLFPAAYHYWRYVQLLKEHQKFMSKYSRS
jgi:membrane protein implicated in regulation of membrane protease activity